MLPVLLGADHPIMCPSSPIQPLYCTSRHQKSSWCEILNAKILILCHLILKVRLGRFIAHNIDHLAEYHISGKKQDVLCSVEVNEANVYVIRLPDGKSI